MVVIGLCSFCYRFYFCGSGYGGRGSLGKGFLFFLNIFRGYDGTFA